MEATRNTRDTAHKHSAGQLVRATDRAPAYRQAARLLIVHGVPASHGAMAPPATDQQRYVHTTLHYTCHMILRWKRRATRGTLHTNIALGSSSALQIAHQLIDKQRAFSLFMEFLRHTGLWHRLRLISRGTFILHYTCHMILRWKRRATRGTLHTNIALGSSSALQIAHQLIDKQRAFSLFMEFLRHTGLWHRLRLISRGTFILHYTWIVT
ncbi:hypothetical protein O0L34_g11037 [Tuta absoluta]|nr:hypothetical protein O0L34_g11037 [Tuta absoluta]